MIEQAKPEYNFTWTKTKIWFFILTNNIDKKSITKLDRGSSIQ